MYNLITCGHKELPLNETLATFPKHRYTLDQAIERYKQVTKQEPETVYDVTDIAEWDMSLQEREEK